MLAQIKKEHSAFATSHDQVCPLRPLPPTYLYPSYASFSYDHGALTCREEPQCIVAVMVLLILF